MPSIGARVCKWTTLLLLCSIPTPAQPTNDTTLAENPSSVSVASSSATKSPSVLTSPSLKPSTASFSDRTCPFRTINYITHTLPQQCLRTAWSAPTQAASSGSDSSGEALPSPWVAIPWIGDGAADNRQETKALGDSSASTIPTSQETGAPDTATASSTTSSQSDAEAETDSPLDNANFLSFEDWKKKNLVRADQSPENVGQGRAASSESRAQRRPVNINALDSLGEESEIEIDFGGFGDPAEGGVGTASSPSGTQDSVEATKPAEDEDNVAPSSWALSKDAGKTCKERFNYASFDCAATVLKTNSRAKSSSAVLVENKDSYMLNECSAQNKFVIVELCDDILVDTVVLANYEFFSSMFRHFRVSVSDRYPVKMDRWRTLATFEARNSRDIQPFLVKAPQIWARYLRIEFLTHYGNEFYCPLSLLRVHGTTMMEQFRREEEEARGDDDFVEPIEAAEGEPIMTAAAVTDSGPVPAEQVPIEPEKGTDIVPGVPTKADNASQPADTTEATSPKANAEPHQSSPENARSRSADSAPPTDSNAVSSDAEKKSEQSAAPSPPSSDSHNTSDAGKTETTLVENSQRTELPAATNSTKAGSASQPSADERAASTGPLFHQNGNAASKASVNETSNTPATSPPTKAASNVTTNSTPIQKDSQTRSSSQTQPNTASPTTQESFFKSIHKRLQQLEANSTLSLQYIEEQSRILRDAFIKVEKRQLSKTEKFLDHLNSTVMLELKSYRSMYDQLWQSTILELESMKERQKAEVGEIGARLSLVADELVWQKRMAVVQSTLLLLCLGLVLFVRSGTVGTQLDVPIVQQLGSKYSRFFDTPPGTPEASRNVSRRRTFRNMWRSDTSGLSEPSGHLSDGINVTSDAETDGRRSPVQVEFSPSTPVTPDATSEAGSSPVQIRVNPDGTPVLDGNEVDGTGLPTPTTTIAEAEAEDQAKRIQVLATQSGPATPRGSRDSRPSWEEVNRAVDLLKAEELGKESHIDINVDRDRPRRKKRSPLRRAESYNEPNNSSNDTSVDDSPGDDDVGDLFVGG